MSGEDPTSTGQSYLDQAKAGVQSVIGAITGNDADKVQASDRKDQAEFEKDASHATAKVGPFTVTPSGVAQDNPDRTQGSWDQTVGSAKESLGGLVGHEGLRSAGEQQNAAGKEQEAKGQLSDLGDGITGRAKGAVGGVVAGVLGDDQAKSDFQTSHDEAKARQRGVEADLQKKAESQQ